MRWLGIVMILSACAGARPRQETSMLMGWPDDARQRIQRVVDAHGRGASSFDPAHPPVAVFDWDNTTARGDVGDLAFAYMLDHDLVCWPDGGLDAWGAVTPAARVSLETACSARPLVTSTEGPCRDRLAQLAIGGEIDGVPAFDPPIGPHYRGNYGMMVRAFAGMDDDAARQIAEGTITRALAQPIGARRTIGGVTFDDFLRVQEPVHALIDELRAAGFDVWIVSASFEPIVQTFAARAGFDRDHVIGARLAVGADGRFLPVHPYEDSLGPLITFDEGKRFWIRHAIFGLSPARAIAAPVAGDPRPVLAGGDSDTDHAMLESASALRILFDRGAPRVTCLARREPATFVVLPQFVDPQPHAPVSCPVTRDKVLAR